MGILPNEKLRTNNSNKNLICCSTNVCYFDIPPQQFSTHIISKKAKQWLEFSGSES